MVTESENRDSGGNSTDPNLSACYFCGALFPKRELERHHLVPKYLGGANTKENVVRACHICSYEQAKKEYAQHLAERVTRNNRFYQSFLQSLTEVKSLTRTPLESDNLKKSLNKLLFVNVIIALETYLSDAFINTVLKDKSLIRKLVETDPEFTRRKVNVCEIFSRMDNLNDEVRDYLLEIIYHNLAKVKQMYEVVLNVIFPNELDTLFKAINTRHDIVHRNGRTKDGTRVEISESNLLSLTTTVESFVGALDKQLPVYKGRH